ncbi:MAG: germination protein YpeB, partial [Oscillospiraceae bacterium]
NGGLISYMIKSREVYTKSIDEKSAINFATKYLQSLGIENIEKTYYEIANNIMTINYASISENIMLYPDLIKVSVAMDNGEIVEFDARGYIVNHKERDIPAVTITSATAQGKLSEFLTPQSTRLALIPLDNLTETLCYEIKCVGDDGQQILVYINAYTGEEERILILLINENGTLTI